MAHIASVTCNNYVYCSLCLLLYVWRWNKSIYPVLPRDAVLARYMLSSCHPVCPSVRPSVRHKPLLHRNTMWMGRVFGMAASLTYPKLCYKEIRVSLQKIRVLPSGTLPQILHSESFTAVGRWCGQQNSSTVELVDHTYDGRARRGWMHEVYYMLVDCNPLTPLLRFVLYLSYKLFLHCCAAVGKILTDTSRRAVCLRYQSFLYIGCSVHWRRG